MLPYTCLNADLHASPVTTAAVVSHLVASLAIFVAAAAAALMAAAAAAAVAAAAAAAEVVASNRSDAENLRIGERLIWLAKCPLKASNDTHREESKRERPHRRFLT